MARRITVCPKAIQQDGQVRGRAENIVCEEGRCPYYPQAKRLEGNRQRDGGKNVRWGPIGEYFRQHPPRGCLH